LKKQNQELENNYKNLEDDYNESDAKYQELYNINLKIQRNFRSQQSMIEQETNTKLQALEEVKQLEGILQTKRSNISFKRD
jgi:hypothetical protein